VIRLTYDRLSSEISCDNVHHFVKIKTMESIFLHLYKILVPVFYAYLLYLFLWGLQTLPPKTIWVKGAIYGLFIGIVWAAFAFLPSLLTTDPYVGFFSYILVGMPLSLPIYLYFWLPQSMGADIINLTVLIQVPMTIFAAILVVGTTYGYFHQVNRNGTRIAASVLVGFVVLGLLTLVAALLGGF